MNMQFPDDVDGDVLRRMSEHGFDFTKPTTIDFNIDFHHWPLSDAEIARIKNAYPNAVAIEPDEEDLEEGNAIGFFQFQINSLVSHDLVVQTQEKATEFAKDFGGWCESWGVMH